MIFGGFPEGPIFTEKKLEKLLIFFFELSDRKSLIFGPPGGPEPLVHCGILVYFSLRLGPPAKEMCRDAVCWIGLVCTGFFCFKPDWTGSFSNMYWIESD